MYEWTWYFSKQILIKRGLLLTELCTVKIARFQSFWLNEIFNRDNRYYIDRGDETSQGFQKHLRFCLWFLIHRTWFVASLFAAPQIFHLSAPFYRLPLCLFWTTTYLFHSLNNVCTGGQFSYSTKNNDFLVSWLVQTSGRDWPSLCVRCFTNYKTIGTYFKPVAAERVNTF